MILIINNIKFWSDEGHFREPETDLSCISVQNLISVAKTWSIKSLKAVKDLRIAKHRLLLFGSRKRDNRDNNKKELSDRNRADRPRSFFFQKGYKEYAGLKVSGANAKLQPPDSNVTIHIPDGVHGLVIAHAHTDFTAFLDAVPESECFISPVVEMQHISDNKNQTEKNFTIKIPHCMENKEDLSNVTVRLWDVNRKSPPTLVPAEDVEVNENFIFVQTASLGQFICSKPGCTNSCQGKGQLFLFGSPPSRQFSLRVYCGNPLMNIPEFKKILVDRESDIGNKRVLLDQADFNWNPEHLAEMEYIDVSLYSPKYKAMSLGQHGDSNTIVQRTYLRDMPCMSQCHSCRQDPYYIAHFDFSLPENSPFSPFTGKLKLLPQGDGTKPILEFNISTKASDLDIRSSNEVHKYLRELTKQAITTLGNLVDFGLALGYTRGQIDLQRTNNPNNLEIAAWNLACDWWDSRPRTETCADKVKQIVQAVEAAGKISEIEQLLRDMPDFDASM